MKEKISIFVCGDKNRQPCGELGCAMPEYHRCAFELKGRLAGSKCDKPLCQPHAIEIDGKKYCPPHARILGKNT